MVKRLQHLLNEIQKLRGNDEEKYLRKSLLDLGEAIEQAQKEWFEAKSMLNHVKDPDLIDHVIFSLEAAEKKYMYLLKVAKNNGYRAFRIEKSEDSLKKKQLKMRKGR